jgi:hypothetical protein
MWDTRHKLPTQRTIGAELSIAGVSDHIRVVHVKIA